MKIPDKSIGVPQGRTGGAFTFIELVVIIAMVALLATLLSPALASTKGRTQRAACANNLKELGLGCLTYAQNYNGGYPITQVGNNAVNVVNGGFYTRWLFFDANRPGFHLSQTWDAGTAPDNPDGGSPNTKTGTFWRNLGMLYPEKLAGDGSMFFCPGLNAKKSIIGSAAYQPLLTTDAGSANPGSVRDSYIYNPWADGNVTRLYQKTSDVKARKVFGTDFMDSTTWNSDGSINTDSSNFAHSREQGWNVLFTDGSEEFKHIDFREGRVVTSSYSLFNTQDDIQGLDQLAQLIFEK
ncbi:MAG TPA: type II secretion system protein [Verrucomicrobiae bacterium]|jgi:type II secretory pathway pseudopilin PulG|nr:type II secretion system protein [Verrucomicrobiae bacterium]